MHDQIIEQFDYFTNYYNKISVLKRLTNVIILRVKIVECVRMESTATRALVQQVTVDATVKQSQ